ncbi:MAG: hypothetical protein ACKOTZ_07690 [Chloroflexota bacterium]
MTPPPFSVIDLNAGRGRADIVAGGRVRGGGSRPFAGETGVIERVIPGAIPAALVRTASGRSGRVRLVDCEPLRGDEPKAPAPDAEAAEA